jgi:hypothetical protein
MYVVACRQTVVTTGGKKTEFELSEGGGIMAITLPGVMKAWKELTWQEWQLAR